MVSAIKEYMNYTKWEELMAKVRAGHMSFYSKARRSHVTKRCPYLLELPRGTLSLLFYLQQLLPGTEHLNA